MEQMTAQEALEAAKGITFEKAWAIMQEDRRKWDEEQRKAEAKRTDEMAEFKKNLEKAVGKLGNSLGELTEALFSGALYTQFEALGYEFTTQSPNKKFFENKQCIAEADYWLEDGDYVMAVEVKTKPTNADVDEHVERLEVIREHMRKRGRRDILIGVVAGGVINESVTRYAHKHGLYVIVQSGESVKIIDPPKGFKVREW